MITKRDNPGMTSYHQSPLPIGGSPHYDSPEYGY